MKPIEITDFDNITKEQKLLETTNDIHIVKELCLKYTLEYIKDAFQFGTRQISILDMGKGYGVYENHELVKIFSFIIH